MCNAARLSQNSVDTRAADIREYVVARIAMPDEELQRFRGMPADVRIGDRTAMSNLMKP